MKRKIAIGATACFLTCGIIAGALVGEESKNQEIESTSTRIEQTILIEPPFPTDTEESKEFGATTGSGTKAETTTDTSIETNTEVPKELFIIDGSIITGLTDYGKTITEIVIPTQLNGKNITSIGSGAFANTKLESVVISDSITQIGSRAFANCYNLKSVVIGEGVTSIGDYAFMGCRALNSIYFNAKCCADIKSSESRVFELAGRDSNGLTLLVGKNVERIPANLFRPYMKEDWANVIAVIFEENSRCSSIGAYAFYRCHNLTTVKFGNSHTVIEKWAFNDCGFTQE